MANLPTLAIGTVNQTYSYLDNISGTEPVLELISAYDDSTWVYTYNNVSFTHNHYFAFDNMPSDFSSMSSISVRLRYKCQGQSNNTWDSYQAQIVKSDGSTALTDLVTVATNIGNTTGTTSSVVALTNPSTTATKADWDGALLRLVYSTTRNKGGDLAMYIGTTAGELTGTYVQGAQTLTPSRYDNSQTFYAATVTPGAVTLTPARYDNSQTFYAATVGFGAQTLTPSRYDNSQTFYAATVTPGAVTLTPNRYDNSQAFYSATVTRGAVTLTPNRYDNAQAFYSPTVAAVIVLSPNRYDNSQAFYSPTVTRGAVTLTPSRYDNAQTFYAATVVPGAVTLTPNRYDNSQAFYSATVVNVPADSLLPALYSNTQTFYSPTVTRGAVTMQPGLYSNSQTFYTHTVSPGAVTLQPSRYNNAQTFFAPTASAGAVTLQPARYDNSNLFYGPAFTPGVVTITPNRYDNSQTFYAANAVVDGALYPALFVNDNTFYLHVVGISVETITQPTGGDYSFLNPRRHYRNLEERKRSRLSAKPVAQSASDYFDNLTPEALDAALADARAISARYRDMLNAGLAKQESQRIDQMIGDNLILDAMRSNQRRQERMLAQLQAEAIAAAEAEERFIVQLLFDL